MLGFVLGIGVAAGALLGAYAHYGTLSPCAWYARDVTDVPNLPANIADLTGDIMAKVNDWSHGRCAAEWAEHHIDRLTSP